MQYTNEVYNGSIQKQYSKAVYKGSVKKTVYKGNIQSQHTTYNTAF